MSKCISTNSNCDDVSIEKGLIWGILASISGHCKTIELFNWFNWLLYCFNSIVVEFHQLFMI